MASGGGSRSLTRNMQPTELVVFDMDGVLADTEPLHFAATNRILAEHGVQVDQAQTRQFLGNTDADYFRALKLRYGLPGTVESYVQRKTAAVLECFAAGLAPNPGVCELVLQLAMRGVPAVVASSSVPAVIDAVIDAIGLRRSFQGLFSASQVERGKPAPDLFLHAARSLRVAPECCLVIEDAPAGVRAARAAGMRVVAVRTHGVDPLELAGAERVLESLEHFDCELLHGA